MGIVRYFYEPCPACREAERPGGPLSAIRLCFTIERFDLRFTRKYEEVRVFSAFTNLIPTIQVGAEWYVGLDSINTLAEMCDRGEPPVQLPVEVDVDA